MSMTSLGLIGLVLHPPPSQDNISGAGKAGDVIVGRRHQPRRQLVEFDGNMIRGTTLGGDPTNLME